MQQLPSIPPDQRFNKILGMSPAAQLALADYVARRQRAGFSRRPASEAKGNSARTEQSRGSGPGELAQAKLLRAIYSERQLQK